MGGLRAREERGTGNTPATALPGRAGPSPWSVEQVPLPGGWLRFETGWLNIEQTLHNLEQVVTLLQQAEQGVKGIDRLVNDLLTVVNTALVEADLSGPPPAALEAHMRMRLGQIDEIVRQCRFHGRGLLDGQCGVVGVGTGVDFVRGGPNTVSSPPEGYHVVLEVLPRRARLIGGVPLTDEWLAAETEIFLAEGENHVRLQPRRGESALAFLARLRTAIAQMGLALEVGLTAQRRLIVDHHSYGSQSKFKGRSQSTPLLSRRPGKVEWCRRGRDIQGTIAGEPAFGIGRMLVGYLDNPRTSELAVVWRGGRSGGEPGGRLFVVQNGLGFQDGEDMTRPIRISLPAFHTRALGRWLDTASGFTSLDAVRVSTWQETRDTLHVLFAVSCELDDWLGNLKAWIRRYQNQALTCLRRGDSLAGEPLPDDPDSAARAEAMARELRELIRGGAL